MIAKELLTGNKFKMVHTYPGKKSAELMVLGGSHFLNKFKTPGFVPCVNISTGIVFAVSENMEISICHS